MIPAHRLPLLETSHLCTGMDAQELEAIARIVTCRELAAGETLFQEGDAARGFYVLLRGRVRIYKSSPDGKEYNLHAIRPGMIFAEVAIFHGGHFPANCVALEDSTVAFFPKEAFLRLLRESPQISLKIIASMALFVRDFNRQIEELSLKEVPARIAAFLLREAERTGLRAVALDITKTELAGRLGTVSETLSRSLRKLKDQGLIREQGKIITLLDPTRLQDIAEGVEKI